jgi:1-deoxy-11beta-hydroxypentalenate dehydrogenase
MTALVTGGGSGIGRALAQRFARAGARVIVVDRNADDAAATSELLGAAGSWHQADVSRPDEVEHLAATVWDNYGGVDLLCNNAGVLGPHGDPLWEIPAEEWSAVLAVNVLGCVHAIQSFVPRMIRRGTSAHIVNTASMAGLTRSPIVPPYAASKHALVAITETLSTQLQARHPSIGVSLLCPGPVTTALVDHADRPGEARTQPDLAREAIGAHVSHLDPAVVAEAVVDAVLSGRFYVFTNPGSRERLDAYYVALLEAAR